MKTIDTKLATIKGVPGSSRFHAAPDHMSEKRPSILPMQPVGMPDIVFPRLNKIINVHGCFWHLHACRHGQRAPVKNAAYWNQKRRGNAERDRRNLRKLRRDGWEVLTIWECQTRDIPTLAARIRAFLGREQFYCRSAPGDEAQSA